MKINTNRIFPTSSNKRQRLNDEKENESDTNKPPTNVSEMILVDLNDDCLDKIFRYLSAADLGSISETCTLFQRLATNAFKCVWKNQPVFLSNNTAKGKLDSLRILRHFGKILQKHLSLQHPFNNRHLANFIRFNQQLKSLELGLDYYRIDIELIKLIDKRLPQLEELKLMEIGEHYATIPYKPLYIKQLKRLIIRDMKNGKFFSNLAISNENVEELNIEVLSCNSNLIDTICEYKAIQNLFLNCFTNNFRGSDLMKLSKELPVLSEILPMKNILHFIQESKHLTKLTSHHFTIDMAEIKEKLKPDQWIVTQSDQQLKICKYHTKW